MSNFVRLPRSILLYPQFSYSDEGPEGLDASYSLCRITARQFLMYFEDVWSSPFSIDEGTGWPAVSAQSEYTQQLEKDRYVKAIKSRIFESSGRMVQDVSIDQMKCFAALEGDLGRSVAISSFVGSPMTLDPKVERITLTFPKLLPRPQDHISIRDIVDFRERNSYALFQFLSHLEDVINYSSEESHQRRLDQARSEIDQMIDRENSSGIFAGMLDMVIKIVLPSAAALLHGPELAFLASMGATVLRETWCLHRDNVPYPQYEYMLKASELGILNEESEVEFNNRVRQFFIPCDCSVEMKENKGIIREFNGNLFKAVSSSEETYMNYFSSFHGVSWS